MDTGSPISLGARWNPYVVVMIILHYLKAHSLCRKCFCFWNVDIGEVEWKKTSTAWAADIPVSVGLGLSGWWIHHIARNGKFDSQSGVNGARWVHCQCGTKHWMSWFQYIVSFIEPCTLVLVTVFTRANSSTKFFMRDPYSTRSARMPRSSFVVIASCYH